MLSVPECRKYLTDSTLSEEQIEGLRDALYVLVEKVLDEML